MTLDELIDMQNSGRAKEAASKLGVHPTAMSSAMTILRKVGLPVIDRRSVTALANAKKATAARIEMAKRMPTTPNPHYDPMRPGTPEWWKARGL